jgi:hypothetical protein
LVIFEIGFCFLPRLDWTGFLQFVLPYIDGCAPPHQVIG